MFEKTDESILGDVDPAGVPCAERIMKLSGVARDWSIRGGALATRRTTDAPSTMKKPPASADGGGQDQLPNGAA